MQHVCYFDNCVPSVKLPRRYAQRSQYQIRQEADTVQCSCVCCLVGWEHVHLSVGRHVHCRVRGLAKLRSLLGEGLFPIRIISRLGHV